MTFYVNLGILWSWTLSVHEARALKDAATSLLTQDNLPWLVTMTPGKPSGRFKNTHDSLGRTQVIGLGGTDLSRSLGAFDKTRVNYVTFCFGSKMLTWLNYLCVILTLIQFSLQQAALHIRTFSLNQFDSCMNNTNMIFVLTNLYGWLFNVLSCLLFSLPLKSSNYNKLNVESVTNSENLSWFVYLFLK